jgi:hypothetical protein
MNASAMADYNYESDKASYAAASHNAPIQAAYNKLALQMGVGSQNAALSAQTGAQNTQLALSAMQALGGMWGGKSGGGGSTIGSNMNQAPAQAQGGSLIGMYGGGMGFTGNANDFTGATTRNGMYYNPYGTPIADAPTITAVS